MDKNMRVTIGVTCFNNGDNIDALLTDIQNQTPLTNSGIIIAEVIVVASGCTDNTVPEIRERASHDPRIHLIVENQRFGKPSAINKILRMMTGDVMVLLSGDVRLSNAHFVNNLVSHCANGAGVAGCRPVPANGTNTNAGYIGSLMWNLHDRTLIAQVKNGLYKQAGEAFAIRRDAAGEVPSNIINDDAYLVLKAQIAGHRFDYARDVVVRNRTPDKLHDFLIQRARIIRGHQQLQEMIGTSPSVLDILVFKRPLIVADVIMNEVREQIAKRTLRASCFFQLILLECAAHLLARVWNSSHLWPAAESARWDREGS
jgi:poly-beta-1,6-N-acetyl-D-glucosamine synthase